MAGSGRLPSRVGGLDQTAAQEPTYANHAQCPWAGDCLELILFKTSDGFPKNSGGDAGVAWGRVSRRGRRRSSSHFPGTKH